MRKRHTEEQIIGILKESEAGAKTPELCRRHGISEGTFYKWKNKFGGMEISDAKKLRGLEDENRRLKNLVADLTLDTGTLDATRAGQRLTLPPIGLKLLTALLKATRSPPVCCQW